MQRLVSSVLGLLLLASAARAETQSPLQARCAGSRVRCEEELLRTCPEGARVLSEVVRPGAKGEVAQDELAAAPLVNYELSYSCDLASESLQQTAQAELLDLERGRMVRASQIAQLEKQRASLSFTRPIVLLSVTAVLAGVAVALVYPWETYVGAVATGLFATATGAPGIVSLIHVRRERRNIDAQIYRMRTFKLALAPTRQGAVAALRLHF